MSADLEYRRCIRSVLHHGDRVITRNSPVFTNHLLTPVVFFGTPLVQFRKTAWKKAISEMEWFMSGDSKCPDNLLDWWDGQLNPNGQLLNGYSTQFRHSGYGFDQVKFILDGLKNNPNSRRLILTAWDAEKMANITEVNENPSSPTSCHSIVVQFFVRNGALHMTTYQRSADMLLGVPHNWIQSWAMLLYFAYHSGLKVGSMQWLWGDAHVYDEFSHTDIASRILGLTPSPCDFELIYNPATIEDDNGVPKFKASDFTYTGTIAAPQITDRPTLL
jgi:thymidylate synthase